ncbi:hypothetical protein [Lyngbya sp. CCY1209]|jgi:hypothetical protein|uniref:hypothetical protein n=1 Tax=Lyngbya sp. CCY1209 TaxID=2886103 RepID=UPI002D20CFEF|nr:hypothetical protein [Lyngbya sp. CCY1209]MEB3882651.1 hypothetical protein [Lyngbya sp. CCY1209]
MKYLNWRRYLTASLLILSAIGLPNAGQLFAQTTPDNPPESTEQNFEQAGEELQDAAQEAGEGVEKATDRGLAAATETVRENANWGWLGLLGLLGLLGGGRKK